MKYFTPELIIMGQSSDDMVLDAQETQWEESGARYVNYLDSIRPHLPRGLRQLDAAYYLHDSVIRGIGWRDRSFVIILQLDTPPQSILTLTYDLVAEPVIVKDVLPAPVCDRGPLVAWLYNELEMVEGAPSTWRESLLLSNGWEIKLHFRDVEVQEVQAVLPAPRHGAAGGSFVAPDAVGG